MQILMILKLFAVLRMEKRFLNLIMFDNQAQQDFERQYRRSFWRKLGTFLQGESNELLEYEEVRRKRAAQAETRSLLTLAEARAVALGPSFENEVVIASGLAEGDRLIVTGHQMVDAGDRVREVSEGDGQ